MRIDFERNKIAVSWWFELGIEVNNYERDLEYKWVVIISLFFHRIAIRFKKHNEPRPEQEL